MKHIIYKIATGKQPSVHLLKPLLLATKITNVEQNIPSSIVEIRNVESSKKVSDTIDVEQNNKSTEVTGTLAECKTFLHSYRPRSCLT